MGELQKIEANWAKAVEQGLAAFAKDADLGSALAPLLAVIDALLPSWTARVDAFTTPSEMSKTIESTLRAEMRRGPPRFTALSTKPGARALAVAPLIVSDSRLIGAVVLSGSAHAKPPRLTDDVLALMRIIALMVDDRAAQERQRARADELTAILEAIPDAVLMVNADGCITRANHAVETLFGHHADGLVGAHFSTLVSGFSTIRALQEASESGSQEVVITADRADGRPFPVGIRARDMELGSNRRFVVIIRDQTRQASEKARIDALRAALEDASRVSALGEMAASIAHETNQPLTSAGNYVDAAIATLARDGEAEQARTLLTSARKMISDCGVIIVRLNRLVRHEATGKEPIEANAVISEAVDSFKATADRLGCAIERRFDPDLPVVEADRIQLQQVVSNLLRNALEAVRTSQDRRITVATQAAGDQIRLIVSDSGPGIPDGQDEDIFESFVTHRRNGAGLGLSVTRRIIQAHGGAIEAGRADEGGARFLVSLPVRRS